MRGGLAAAWFASLGLVSWRTVHNMKRPPLPSEVLATIVVFGGLSMLSVSETAAPVAMLFGWGVVVSQVLGFFPATPGSDFPSQSRVSAANTTPLRTVQTPTGQSVTTTGSTP